MSKQKIEWFFPERRLWLMRLEIFSIILISLIVFVLTWLSYEDLLYSILLSFIFMGIYFIVSYLVQFIHKLEEKYSLKKNYLTIIRKSRFNEKKDRILIRKIIKHKVDHFFQGAYIITKVKRYPLFFNTKEESIKVKEFLDKHVKKYTNKKVKN